MFYCNGKGYLGEMVLHRNLQWKSFDPRQTLALKLILNGKISLNNPPRIGASLLGTFNGSGEFMQIPFKFTSVRVRQTSRRKDMKQGVSAMSQQRHPWITAGPVRDIEIGLPLTTGTHYERSYREVMRSKDRIQAMEADLSKLAGNEPVKDRGEPVVMPSGRDVTAREESEIQKMMVRLEADEARASRGCRTGINSPAEKQIDIVDAVGRLAIRSVTSVSKRPENVSPFPKSWKMPKRDNRSASTVQLVKAQMQRVFKHGCEPFKDVDTLDDFPMDGAEPETVSNSAESYASDISLEIELPEYPQTMLIDSSDQDIFFAVNKAPFTRGEVDLLYSWRKKSEDMVRREEEKRKKRLKEREDCILRTFQSRMAFNKKMALMERTCDSVASLGPGKGQIPRESSWKTAARCAEADPSSLQCRKESWARFIQFAKEHDGLGGVLQNKLGECYRRELISGNVLSSKMFWNVIEQFDDMDFVNLPFLRYVEFLRQDFGVGQHPLVAFLDGRQIPSHFYFLAIEDRRGKRDVTRQRRNVR
jgi:hypothetical protein